MGKAAIPGIELETVFNISLRFIELNALAEVNLQNTRGTGRGEYFSYESLVECIMASSPPFTPTTIAGSGKVFLLLNLLLWLNI